jgi:chitodextrinase
LKATVISLTQINLSWTASTDNIGVKGYNVLRNGTKVGITASTSYSDMGLTAGTAYSYTVSAFDAAGNISTASAALSATTLAPVMFQISADANPINVLPGQTVQLGGAATARYNESNFGIVLKVTHDKTIIAEQSFTGLNFTAGQPVTENFPWTVPSSPSFGTYALTVRVINAKGNGVGHATTYFKVIRPAINGACGTSGGATLTFKPTTDLCSTGVTSAVRGRGPWTWSCKGSNGGSTAQCSANK